ncbi:MAG: PD-(D/E)XK nuclease domain-containing protein [Lachnospiraceae bacterium]|jgi:hypothetical protein|nr:PD-(D/E)XK nuclease domain-containing protein [Lachnospiraceae bacterium]MEE3460805.1 PD-(D/E)XK nuclease domain-containing protein [Lachnospiraceae bacterium]
MQKLPIGIQSFEDIRVNTKAEVHSSGGRSDCILENRSAVYIFEFKYDKSAEEALKQINENGYDLSYTSDSRKIIKIGANFSSKAGKLDEWKTEDEEK